MITFRLSETPPPPNTWQVSPVARHSHTSSGTSPLRRSTGNNSASSPLLTGPLAVLGSPTSRAFQDNNNTLRHSPVIPFGTRAVTLPEISGTYFILFANCTIAGEIFYVKLVNIFTLFFLVLYLQRRVVSKISYQK